MEKILKIDFSNSSNCRLIDFEPIINTQEKRVYILQNMLAVASGDGDTFKAMEIRNLLNIEEEVLTKMKKMCGKND